MKGPRIGIAGAGLSGLCLAQRLVRAGMSVEVYERDPGPDTRTQGYRLRIDAQGQRALAACLAPAHGALLRRLGASHAGTTRLLSPDMLPCDGRRPDSWWAAVRREPDREAEGASDDLSINRLTLRELLCDGLAERIRFGWAVSDVQVFSDGVAVRFGNGECREVDVLVGADGVASTLRKRLMPDLEPDYRGALTIYGKTPLDEKTRMALEPGLLRSTTVVFGDGLTLIVEPMVFARRMPELAAAYAAGCRLSHVEDYVYWAFIGRDDRLGSRLLRGVSPSAELRERIGQATRDWHPHLHALLELADDSSLSARPVLEARSVPRWESGRIAFMGDAIHPMSPAGGLGANTALADAAELGARLCEVRQHGDPAYAVQAYETNMRIRAEVALRASSDAGARLLRVSDASAR